MKQLEIEQQWAVEEKEFQKSAQGSTDTFAEN